MEHIFEEDECVYITVDGVRFLGTIIEICGSSAEVEYYDESIGDYPTVTLPLDAMEYIAPKVASLADLQKLVRYELLPEALLADPEVPESYTAEQAYPVTLADLRQCLVNLKEKHILWEAFNEWFYFVKEAEDGDTLVFPQQEPGAYYMLPKTEADMIRFVYREMQHRSGISWWEPDTTDGPYLDFELLIADIDRFGSGETVVPWFWNETDFLMHLSDEAAQRMETAALPYARDILERAAAAGSTEAIEKIGYFCYGGSRLYGCDWVRSRDCFLQLMQHPQIRGEEKTRYANTLGYIYYYGRCTDGIPDYEHALKYFTIGALGMMHESIYKLADMYLHGYGTEQNTYIAANLIEQIYKESMRWFVHGDFGCKLADCALRMGNLEWDGYLNSDDPMNAYFYYTIADFAIRKRMQTGEHYGDKKVFAGIQRELEKMHELYPLKEDRTITSSIPERLFDIFHDEYACEVTITQTGTDAVFAAKRLPKRQETAPAKMLDCCPEHRICQLTDSITLKASGIQRLQLLCGSSRFIADEVRFLENNGSLKYGLFHHDELQAEFIADTYSYTIGEETDTVSPGS